MIAERHGRTIQRRTTRRRSRRLGSQYERLKQTQVSQMPVSSGLGVFWNLSYLFVDKATKAMGNEDDRPLDVFTSAI
jgi:hypothetical protein